jgi:hypothetical protein
MPNEYDRSEFIGAATADDEKKAPKKAYVHKDWPALRYGPNGQERKVNSQKDADALGADWKTTPPLPEKEDDAAGPARKAEVRTKAGAKPVDKKPAEPQK